MKSSNLLLTAVESPEEVMIFKELTEKSVLKFKANVMQVNCLDVLIKAKENNNNMKSKE